MAIPTGVDVWLVDMGYAAKVRPALVLSVQIQGDERILTTVIPHTTSARGTRLEFVSDVRWLKEGAFDAQGIGTYPTVKLIKRLRKLPDDQLSTVERCVLVWLGFHDQQDGG